MNSAFENQPKKKHDNNLSNGDESGNKDQKSNALQIPSITLPKGGGAIKSIDEKFSVNSSNGTASFDIPFPFSKSRNDFMPSLSLSYNSGAGNGIFGLGWSVDVPCITRKTEKELPQYRDTNESDTFIFSGVEDLVPELVESEGKWIKDSTLPDSINRYKPRIENSFSRIEKIIEADGNVYWKVTTKENITSVFGKSVNARIASPADPTKIFKWMLEFSYDDKGNCFLCEYKSENKDEILSVLHEKNRLVAPLAFTNTYLKRVKYCNKNHFDRTAIDFNAWNKITSLEFLLELVLDYGEHDLMNPKPDDSKKWDCRIDAFSSYRAGFEIRTYRLCNRILMFHHFDELGNSSYLTRSIELSYDKGNAFTFLKSIVQKGFIKIEENAYSLKPFPPLEFDYEKLRWSTEIKSITEENIVNAPIGIDDKNYQWIDLYGEGISGILTEQSTGWYYKGNNGDGSFTNASIVAPKPSFTGLSTGLAQLTDIEANGKKSLISYAENGYFEFTEDDEWLPFKNFKCNPNFNFNNPNLKFLDLNGDGRADILISEDEVFTWYASLGKDGYDDYQYVRKVFDEEQGPNVIFADSTQSILLADMSGDGLSDIVRIFNGEIVYWPNLGYGRFGKKVAMSNAPLFDSPEAFNSKFIKLADIDGSGATDIVYLGKNTFKIYFNQSGNSWSEVNIIKGINPLPFPNIDDFSNVSVIDLLGSGTSCIVWSSPLPSNSRYPMLYIDLMGGKKPHVLTSYKNNSGKETFLEYTPSTKFYLEDKKQGSNWITKLPFPVQCVSKVEVKDRISKTRYANEYSYHHGYYDYIEREFRGFGRVEQIDTDTFNSESLDQFPVVTKTWFHTGAFFNKDRILKQFEKEYFYNDPEVKKQLAVLNIFVDEKELSEPALTNGLTTDEWREALRACKNLPLRVEIFSNDGSDKKLFPYSSAQHTCEIKLVQPKLGNKHAVFMVHEAEALTYQYERNPTDPRIAHILNTDIDENGNVKESASIVYGRKDNADRTGLTDDDFKIQQQAHIIYTKNNFTNAIINSKEDYRLKLLYETCTYEITGKDPVQNFYSIDEIKNNFANAAEINYEDLAEGNELQKRIIEHTRTLFFKNDLSNPCKIGELESLALPFQSYQLAFTKALFEERYNEADKIRVDDNLLTTVCRYSKLADEDGAAIDPDNYWIASGKQTFDPLNFYQVTKITDPFNNATLIEHDNKYHFFIQRITDPLLNVSEIYTTNEATPKICFNFRTLLPYVMKDINDNRTGIRIDELGMVCKTFVMGKDTENLGDPIDIASIEMSANDKATTILEYTIDSWFNQSKTFAPDFDFDVDNYKPQPNFLKLNVREKHESETQNPIWQISYSYSDGSGHEIMKKIQAEPGDAPKRDANENLVLDAEGQVILVATNPRWVGTGRTILNNKGKPVKQYEPFFSSTFHFEDEKEMVEQGVTPLIHYDALGRVIKTDFPDGTFSEVIFDAWRQTTYDQNDTIGRSKWYDERILHPVAEIATDEEKDAAQKAFLHNDTPTIAHLDSLGRMFLSIADNGGDEKYRTLSEIDIEGNIVKVTDALNNPVMQYQYDMLGNIVYQNSMDASAKRMLNDVSGKPVRTWSNRENDDFTFLFEYDELHRPTQLLFARNNNDPVVYEKINYGKIANKNLNQCGKSIEHKDSAGIIKNNSFDFKGNLLSSSRQLLKNYKDEVNWNGIVQADLENEIFLSSTDYDALNRPVKILSPSTSPETTNIKANEITPLYNEANLLNGVKVKFSGAAAVTDFVKDINYNAKGQRESITYGNDTLTKYTHNKKTFRLINLVTFNKDNTIKYQDLKYTYDPVGNITLMRDDAQQTIYFGNKVVEPKHGYIYDAIYRLTQATGREHIGQNVLNETNNNNNIRNFPFNTVAQNIPSPADTVAMRSYTQKYTYDSVGNIKTFDHKGKNPDNSVTGFTRNYFYNSNDADRVSCNATANPVKNNRLLRTQINDDKIDYSHDEHGNMTNMPHLSLMTWDFKDQLHNTQQTAGGTGEKTYYVYDVNGQRVRKITERQGTIKKKSERIYLNGFEIYRSYKNDGNTIELQRETLHVMDDKRRIALAETKTVENGSDDQTALNTTLLRYQYNNHLDSACLELNENAAIISYEEYHPYGTTSYQAINATINPTAKRYRYTGKERDEETGLNYHGARYYLTWLATWLNADPIGIKDGINVYRYSNNNPIVYNDTNGKECNSAIASCVEETSSRSLEIENKRSSADDKAADKMNYENKLTSQALQDRKGQLPPFDEKRWRQDIDSALQQTETPQYKTEKSIAAAERARQAEYQAAAKKEVETQKELPQGAASFIPVWDPAKSAYVRFKHGDYGLGVVDTALAISDVALVKSLVVGGGKLLIRGGAKLLAASVAEENAPKLIWSGGESQWGAHLSPPSENKLTLSGFRLAPTLSELEVSRVYTPRVLSRAEQVGARDLGHNFPALLDPLIFSSDVRYLRPGGLGRAGSITYSAAGSLGFGERATVGAFEIGVLEGAQGEERIIHRSFTTRIPSL